MTNTGKQRLRPAAAASRWEHKAFRKLCALLSQLSGLNKYHGSKISLDERKLIAVGLGADGTQRRREFELLECLSGLVPGIIAFTPSAIGDAVMQGSDQDAWVIFASVNPQWEEVEEQSASADLGKHGPRLFVTFKDISETPKFIETLRNEGAVAFVFDQLSRKYKFHSTDALLQHSKNLLHLLKMHYHAADQSSSTPEGKGKDKAGASSTPIVDVNYWARAFSELSHTWMFPSVIRHIEHGFYKRNFGTLLASTVDDILKAQLKNDGAMALVPEDELGRLKAPICFGREATNRAMSSVVNIPFSKGGRFNSNATLDIAHRMGQSRVQAEILESIYDQICIWKAKGIIKVDDDINLDWNRSSLNARDDPEKMFYDVSGRLEFQSLLSSVLSAVTALANEAMKTFRKLNAEAQKHTAMKTRENLGRHPTAHKKQERMTERRRIIKNFVDQLHAYMEASLCLGFLRRHFSDILQAHCVWLEKIFQLTSTHLEGFGWLVITVNKRRCSSWFRLLKHVEGVTGVEFLYAGDHSGWPGVSLPPFTPREDFKVMSRLSNDIERKVPHQNVKSKNRKRQEFAENTVLRSL